MFFIIPIYNSNSIEKYIKDFDDVAGSKNLLIRDIGSKLARSFKMRYEQIKSFPNFGEFVNARIDRTESLVGDLKGYYSMTLDSNYRIIISPDTNDYGISNLMNIKTFKIIGVIDYHGTGKNDNKWIIK